MRMKPDMPAGVQLSRQSRNRGLAGLTKYIKGVILSPFIDAKIRTILKDYMDKTYPDISVIQSLIIDKVR